MFEKLANRGTMSRVLAVFLFMLVVSTSFTGMAAAAVGSDDKAEQIDPKNFICNNSDTVFVSFMQTAMGLFFIGSFAFGIISFAIAKVDDADSFDIMPWDADEEAIKAAFILPVGVWFITFMGNALFGYDLSCIMPLQ